MIEEKHSYVSTGKQGAFDTLEDGVAQGFLIQKTLWVVTDSNGRSWEFTTELAAKHADRVHNGQAYVDSLHAELMKKLDQVKITKSLCANTQREIDTLAEYKASYEAEDFTARRFDILKDLQKKAYIWLNLSSRIFDDLTFDQLYTVSRIALKARLAKNIKRLQFAREGRNAARHDLDAAKAALKAAQNSVNLENTK